MPSLPTPFRAAIGLAAQVLQDAKHLPDKAIELPMLAVSTALQMSLRAQQRYALLAARGDDVLNRRPTTDEPPPWATFDDPPVPTGRPTVRDEDAIHEVIPQLPRKVVAATAAPRKAVPARTNPADVAPRRAVPAKQTPVKAVPGKAVPGKAVPDKAVPDKAVPDKAVHRKSPTAKTVRSPRNAAPSRFDTIGDE